MNVPALPIPDPRVEPRADRPPQHTERPGRVRLVLSRDEARIRARQRWLRALSHRDGYS